MKYQLKNSAAQSDFLLFAAKLIDNRKDEFCLGLPILCHKWLWGTICILLLAVWRSGDVFRCINEVTLHRAQLV